MNINFLRMLLKSRKKSNDPGIKRLLGAEGDMGAQLRPILLTGLTTSIAEVGNYGESVLNVNVGTIYTKLGLPTWY